jgi:hypothetical protein
VFHIQDAWALVRTEVFFSFQNGWLVLRFIDCSGVPILLGAHGPSGSILTVASALSISTSLAQLLHIQGLITISLLPNLRIRLYWCTLL